MTMKRSLIFWGVILYFGIGILAGFPSYYHIRQMPFLSFNVIKSISQNWYMYAPPPEQKSVLKFSALTPKGWSDLKEPFENIKKELKNSLFFLPRGAARIQAFLTPQEYRVLTDLDLTKFYFQQISDYYCFGDGKIAELQKIRFYTEKKPGVLFYTSEELEKNIPLQDDNAKLLYERNCSDI